MVGADIYLYDTYVLTHVITDKLQVQPSNPVQSRIELDPPLMHCVASPAVDSVLPSRNVSQHRGVPIGDIRIFDPSKLHLPMGSWTDAHEP